MEKTNNCEKSMKPKTGFYIKINKVNTFLVRLTNKKKDTNFQYLKWKRGHAHWSCNYHNDNEGIFRITLCQ